MCDGLLGSPRTDLNVKVRTCSDTDVGKGFDLLKFAALEDALPTDDLCSVDMDYSGTVTSGQVGSWGQTGCTVAFAIETTGTGGTWAYCSHVRSMENRIEGGVNQLCKLLKGRESGVVVMVGTAAGTSTCTALMKRLRVDPGKWSLYYFAKPEATMTETLVDVGSCCFEFPTAGTVNSDIMDRPENYGLVPYVARLLPTPEWETGFQPLDEFLGTGMTKVNLWVCLFGICSFWLEEALGENPHSKMMKTELVEDLDIVERMLKTAQEHNPEYRTMNVGSVLAYIKKVMPDLT